jgi:hypothetical protein
MHLSNLRSGAISPMFEAQMHLLQSYGSAARRPVLYQRTRETVMIDRQMNEH